ncbi:hypothetical protein Tco_1305452 [Tanacetum coccineum]
MANLEFCDKHNMVAYLQKSEGSAGFHQIIDFLSTSHIQYALTENPIIYTTLIYQFWDTAFANTSKSGEMKITATIDGRVITVTEASIRRHLKLEDSEGIPTLPIAKIFEQLTHMGYASDSDNLTFQKGYFSPQWRTYSAPTLTNKLFSNMKRVSKGYSGVDTSLFPTMITAPETSPFRITSSPSLSPQSHLSPSQSPNTQPTPDVDEPVTMPYDSPLQSVHSLERDERSMQQNELMNLVTKLTDKVAVLENDLQQTKKLYSYAFTKLIPRVKTLEKQVKTTKSRRRARIVILEDEDVEDTEVQEDADIQIRTSDDTEVLLEEEEPTKLLEDQGSGEKGEKEISTTDVLVSTDKLIQDVSTAARRIILQEQIDEEERKRIARDGEIARQLQEEINIAGQEQEVVAEADPAQDIIDWSDPALEVQRLQRAGKEAQEEPAKKQVEKEIVQQEYVVTEQVVLESSKKAEGRRKKSLARKRRRESLSEESLKKQRLEDDAEKEELQVYLNIISKDEGLDVESLATKYPIVDWETQILATDKYYYQIKRADGSIKHYNLFSAMRYDFDRQDVLELHKLVKERF